MIEPVIKIPNWAFIDVIPLPDDYGDLDFYKNHESVTEFIKNFKNEIMEKKPAILRWLDYVYNTNKFITFFLNKFQDIAFDSLGDTYVFKNKYNSPILLLPNTYFFRKIGSHLIGNLKSKCKFSNLLSIIMTFSTFIWMIYETLNTFRIKIKKRKKIEGFILRELQWGFNSDGKYCDDMLVDNKLINENDMVYYTLLTDNYDRDIYEQVKGEKNNIYNNTEKCINFNRSLLLMIYYNLILTPTYVLLSIFSIDYFMFIPSMIKDSSRLYRMMSFVNVKFHFSTRDWGDQLETVILNLYGVQNFLYFWSDMAAYISIRQQTSCHNIVFHWSKFASNLYIHSSSKVNINKIVGCPFKMFDYDRDDIRQKYNFNSKQTIITFFDGSYGGYSLNSKKVFLEFYQSINYIDQNIDKDIIILLKPKYHRKKTECCNPWEFSERVILLDPFKFPSAAVIKLSNVNIGLGPCTIPTISLINGIPGIYHDFAGTTSHPLSKYEGNLFVRNKEDLLIAIKKHIEFKGDIRDKFPEIRKFDTGISNPVNEIRKFLLTFKS